MRSGRWITAIAVGALSASAACGMAWAQASVGSVYVFHSKAMGGCPSLDWHVVVGPNNTLAGMIAWDDMKAMAHATGTMGGGKFTMTAKEVGGQGRTATVDGTVAAGWLVANIKGPSVDCKDIKVMVWNPGPPNQ